MKFEVTLPSWAIDENKKLPSHFATLEERMAVVIRFAELNLTHDTGGPFAAGIFEKQSGKCVIIGSEPSGSVLHIFGSRRSRHDLVGSANFKHV